METGGFIKLYRNLINNPVFMDKDLLQLLIYILCKASYEEKDVLFNGSIVHLLPGEMVSCRKNLAVTLQTTDSTIYNRLTKLVKLGLINIKSNNRFTVISVANQGVCQTSSKKVNSKLNSQQTADKQQTNNQQTADEHNKRNKEIYNINNNIYIPPIVPLKGDDGDTDKKAFGEYGNVLLTSAEFDKLAEAFPGTYLEAIKELDLLLEESDRNKKRYEGKKHYIVLQRKLGKIQKDSSVKKDDGRLTFDLDEIFALP